MKRDEQIERAFDEYFDGVTPPGANVLDEAKNLMERNKRRQKIIKRTMAITAGVACVCLCTVGIIYAPFIGGNKADGNNSPSAANPGQAGNLGPSAADPGQSDSIDNSSSGNRYPDAGLSTVSLNLYDTDLQGIKFLKTLDIADNFEVTDFTGHYNGKSLSYVSANVQGFADGYRHDVTVYAEYSTGTCDLFDEYFDGDTEYYDNLRCYVSSALINGEYVKKVFTEKRGVKYYFEVTSSDPAAYAGYLYLINKF